MTDKPITYSEIWAQYAEGKVSTCVMRRLLKDDEVFRAWCVKRAAAERAARDRREHVKQISREICEQYEGAFRMLADVETQERRARDKQAGSRLIQAAKEALEIAQGGISDEDMA